MNVVANKMTTSINQVPIIKNIDLEVKKDQFIGLIGPNGSGKSTILKSIYRLLSYEKGTVYIGENELNDLSSKQLAQKMAVVSQENATSFDFTVEELVLMGRAPHKKWFEIDHERDHQFMIEALERVGLLHKRKERLHTLSGGEKQRVYIARAIAQQAKILVLDEPTNHLDIHHQLQLMDVAKSLNKTVVAALHDLNIAAAYCEQIYIVNQGEIVTYGTPEEVLTTEILRDVFQVEAEVNIHPTTNKLQIAFISSRLKTEIAD